MKTNKRIWGVLLASFAALAATACGDDGEDEPMDTGSTTQTLCDKYGGADNVSAVVNMFVVPEIAADCRVNTFFTSLPPAGLVHVSECLTIQVQELFGCEGISYAGATDSSGAVCRDMKSSHQGLGISKGDFDALIEDVVAALTKAGVEQADIEAAAPALLGMEADIVEDASVMTASQDMCGG